MIYFRAGNSSDEMIYIIMMRDGVPMRYFAVGARAGMHVDRDLYERSSVKVGYIGEFG